MRKRTIALLAASVATVGAASIGAAAAVLLGTCSADRVDRAYASLSKLFFTMPPLDAPDPPRPRLVVLQGGLHAPDLV